MFVVDFNSTPCITAKKREVKGVIKNIDKDRIMVVKIEIESWYLAGLDVNSSKTLGIASCNDTNNLTKEQFDRLIPKRFDSRIDFMQETLKHFQMKVAKQKNKSFKYFFEKHDCNV